LNPLRSTQTEAITLLSDYQVKKAVRQNDHNYLLLHREMVYMIPKNCCDTHDKLFQWINDINHLPWVTRVHVIGLVRLFNQNSSELELYNSYSSEGE
jgi:hypothetical protein